MTMYESGKLFRAFLIDRSTIIHCTGTQKCIIPGTSIRVHKLPETIHMRPEYLQIRKQTSKEYKRARIEKFFRLASCIL